MGRYALLIGISEYRDPKVGSLKKSVRDVDALERVLADPERGNFSVTKLINCSRRDAERAVSALTQKRVHGETILIYFSGHGIRDDDCNLYLALSDTEADDLWATALLAPNLCHVLDKSLADEQLIILDCCHSGSFASSAKAIPGESVGTKDIFIREGKGRVVLTASDATSFAWESGHDTVRIDESLFTHHLVRGIESGDADLEGDALIDADELYRYVYREVKRDRMDQHPLKFGHAQEGKLVISRAPVKIQPLPTAVISAVMNPIRGVRLAIVETLENTVQHGKPGERIAAYAALKTLARDDSREVSSAATGALKRHAMPHGFVEEESERAAIPTAADSETIAHGSQRPTSQAATAPLDLQLAAFPSPEPSTVTASRTPSSVPELIVLPDSSQQPSSVNSGELDEEVFNDSAAHVLTPSLLDRLIDHNPMDSIEVFSQRHSLLRESTVGLRRDIESLLASISPMSDALAEFPEVQSSVLNYGLPEIQSFERYTPAGHHRIGRGIREVLRRFEPRLADLSVTPIIDEAGPSGPCFRIEGATQADLGDGPVRAIFRFTANFDSGPPKLVISV